jgi:hypothetical protein
MGPAAAASSPLRLDVLHDEPDGYQRSEEHECHTELLAKGLPRHAAA